MNKRLLSVFAFALAVSAGAAFVLYQLIASRVKASIPVATKTTKVYVAAHDLELGALIQEKDLRFQEYLTPPAGAVTKKEDLVGRGVITPVHEDAPFFEASLAPRGAGAGFASIIPKGMRAFAIRVNDVAGLAGFVVAGMHVDVLVSGNPTGSVSEAGAVSRTLLQNVEVLSAGQNYQKDAEGKPVLVQVVNILVTPEQAEIMDLAADQKIQLVLRNPTDHDVVKTPGASTSNLFEGGSRSVSSAKMAPSAAPPRVYPQVSRVPLPPLPPRASNITVEVFAGNRRSETTFVDVPVEAKP